VYRSTACKQLNGVLRAAALFIPYRRTPDRRYRNSQTPAAVEQNGSLFEKSPNLARFEN
jgi:hypothetical protein